MNTFTDYEISICNHYIALKNNSCSIKEEFHLLKRFIKGVGIIKSVNWKAFIFGLLIILGSILGILLTDKGVIAAVSVAGALVIIYSLVNYTNPTITIQTIDGCYYQFVNSINCSTKDAEQINVKNGNDILEWFKDNTTM